MVVRTNLFSGEKCGRKNCGACAYATKPTNCRRRSIMYQTACTECMVGDKSLAVYVGESARSGSERMTEHLDNARDKRADSHIFKHWSNQHGGRQTGFSFKILKFFGAPLERQVGEAVRIARTGANTILNSKSVYNRNPLVE